MLKPDKDLITRFSAIVGEKYALTDPDLQAAYLHEMRDRWVGTTPLVLRPETTEQVSAILKLANETRTAIVPQGGNTGLVGGQIPFNNEIVLSLNRMTAIRELDPVIEHHHGGSRRHARARARSRSRRPTGSIRNCCRAKAPAPSAAISRPMPAAPQRSRMASRARMRSASKWCWRTGACCTISTS